ncbi:hypothetical protein G3N95_35030 [Paraburkholderia sp. Tr-20389]|uniref:hypothetical protein n=1 Tax=Paraburkholderia sp. Tr-20389 TaxID=2703903 RepID=UPI00197E063D|nr:hypothetical protein [Paraburkholderia sp. Tr-20389]MBN3758175.1 hypothetical protein [Paraburkholderia sp. Tr-20389]
MAGDWIKMRTALADDPAVIAMAERLGEDEFTIVGRLHYFWGWADAQSRDGHAPGVTKRWIDRYCRCDGFADAMIAVGWLVVDDVGVTLPNFERHNGSSSKDRALATVRKQKQRASETLRDEVSRSERDIGVTREEKRREESKTEGSNRTYREFEESARASAPLRAADLSAAMRSQGIEASPADPRLQALAAQGVERETVEAAASTARRARPNERIAPGYVISIIERWAAEAKRIAVAGGCSPTRAAARDVQRSAAAASIGLGVPTHEREPRIIDSHFERVG